MTVLPFGVGVFISLQLIMLALKLSLPTKFSFGGNGFVVWLPIHLLCGRLIMFFLVTENRSLKEKTNIVKGKADENQYEMLNAQYLEIEQSSNRIFFAKMFALYMVFFWESLRESLTRYSISVWSTFGIAIGLTMMFAMEGLMHNAWWWHDARALTRKQMEEREENDG